MTSSPPRKLRVCMIMPKWHIGGAEMQVLELLKNLDRSRFALSMCLLNHGDRMMEAEADKYLLSVRYFGFRWRWFPVSFFRLARHLSRGRFDVVHAHLAHADMLGLIAAWSAGVPVRITTEHGKNLMKSRPRHFLEKALNRIADARICVSRDIMEIRRTRERIQEEKLFYIPNAVDPGAFRNPSRKKEEIMSEFGWQCDAPLVITVGRIVEEKNYPLLMEAFSIMGERIPEARCLVVGDGDRMGEVKEKAVALGMTGRVAFAGSRRDTKDLLLAADVFVLSSVREGLPVSLLEAMAAGTPVASTAVGGIPEAVTDGVSALLVPSGDAGALAGAMERLLTDRRLAEGLSRAASREIEERFSIKSAAAALGKIYEELAARKGNKRMEGAR